MTKAFQSIDKDRSGGMTHEEILKEMLSMQLHCDPDEVESLMQQCDTNGDGIVDFNEFRQGVMKLSHEHGVWHPGVNQPLKAMVLKHDLGKATEDPATEAEMKQYMSQLKQAVDSKYNALRKAFRALDRDASNHLSKAEIVDAVQHFALPIPESHIGEVFDQILDIDGNGNVSYTEFCEKMKTFDFN